jgi:peptide chain release factor 3
VQPFLEEFLNLAPAPGIRTSTIGEIDPEDTKFSGFVFKIQANMNPTHRDRIAFIRICSGKFTRGMSVNHIQAGKEIRLSQPQQFMAQERTIVEEAYPGDIIGVFDPGIFGIGDSLYEGNAQLKFEGIPVFPAEHFARVTAADSMKRKQFLKGINELSEEGAIQAFRQIDIGIEALIIGAVGALQFEVLEHRLKFEYGVDIRMQHLPYRFARWVKDQSLDPRKFNLTSSTAIVQDKDDKYVLLFENDWSMRWSEEKNKNLELAEISVKEFN